MDMADMGYSAYLPNSEMSTNAITCVCVCVCVRVCVCQRERERERESLLLKTSIFEGS